MHVCLCLQYVPQAGEPPKTPSYPLGKNVMGELGLSTWGRALLELTEATRQNAVLKLQNGEWPESDRLASPCFMMPTRALRAGQYTAELSTKSPLTVWAKMWRKNKQTDELEDVSNCVLVRAIELKQQIAVYTPADGEYVLALYGDTLVDTSTSWDKHYDKDEQKQFDENTTCLVCTLVSRIATLCTQMFSRTALARGARVGRRGEAGGGRVEPAGARVRAVGVRGRPAGGEPAAEPLGATPEAEGGENGADVHSGQVGRLREAERAAGLRGRRGPRHRARPAGLDVHHVPPRASGRLQAPKHGAQCQALRGVASHCCSVRGCAQVRVQVRFARAGFYVLSLFDAPKDIGKSRLVYSYLLEVFVYASPSLHSSPLVRLVRSSSFTPPAYPMPSYTTALCYT